MKKIALGFVLAASIAFVSFAGSNDKGKKCGKGHKACSAEQKAQCDKDGKKCCSKDEASAETGKKCCAKKAE